MTKSRSVQPTQLELEILKVLWGESPLSARDVRSRLEQDAERSLMYSSVITMLNIMVRKGFLTRRKEGKAFLFAPKVAKQRVVGGILNDLLSRLFDGSRSALVSNLLETGDLDEAEVAELRRLIHRKAKEQQK